MDVKTASRSVNENVKPKIYMIEASVAENEVCRETCKAVGGRPAIEGDVGVSACPPHS